MALGWQATANLGSSLSQAALAAWETRLLSSLLPYLPGEFITRFS